ncbi:hypothetical protein AB0I84_38715 [Streptomyces spectabilis]|uniref:hypothetical protein n=1 Tax=Streptomyces spectabilis TaxID=68270 RepID=UPI003406AE77
MISIRVICHRKEAEAVLADLGRTFTIKDSCQYLARTPDHVRLYVDALPAPACGPHVKAPTARRAHAN